MADIFIQELMNVVLSKTAQLPELELESNCREAMIVPVFLVEILKKNGGKN